MTRRNKNIPFVACDNCVEIISIINDKDHGLDRYSDYLKKQNPEWKNCSSEEFAKAFIELGDQFWPEGKCPFQYKPNLKIVVRRTYRMKCFCGEAFACPAQVVRYKGRPYCGSCLGDAISSDQDDGYCPTAEDDQREVNRWLVNRYGEC